MKVMPQPEEQVGKAADSGMFAMMAVCCIGVLVLLAVVPLMAWPAGAIVALGLGAALMYAHMKMMHHGSHHGAAAATTNTEGDRK
ncbi:MAG: hypothetical protein C0506_14230 [Anaerolinea sp.]|nr:hypothetical protein [Anaerolinea sp.]